MSPWWTPLCACPCPASAAPVTCAPVSLSCLCPSWALQSRPDQSQPQPNHCLNVMWFATQQLHHSLQTKLAILIPRPSKIIVKFGIQKWKSGVLWRVKFNCHGHIVLPHRWKETANLAHFEFLGAPTPTPFNSRGLNLVRMSLYCASPPCQIWASLVYYTVTNSGKKLPKYHKFYHIPAPSSLIMAKLSMQQWTMVYCSMPNFAFIDIGLSLSGEKLLLYPPVPDQGRIWHMRVNPRCTLSYLPFLLTGTCWCSCGTKKHWNISPNCELRAAVTHLSPSGPNVNQSMMYASTPNFTWIGPLSKYPKYGLFSI